MRRNSTNQNYLRLLFVCLGLVFYQALSSLYPFLPLFVGVFFSYIVINFENNKSRLYIYLSFAYLSIYDLDKGFYLFSSIFFVMFFYYFFLEKIRNFIICNSCVIAIYVTVAYLGHFFLNVFIAYVLNQDLPYFSQEYFYYIILDILVSIILFRGKI